MNDTASPKHTPKTDPPRDRTVVALASAPGTAAIAVVQLAGPDARAILARHIKPDKPPLVGRITHAFLRDADDRRIDHVLITRVADNPPIYEITCHGGMRIIQRVIETFQHRGAELIMPQGLSDRVYQLDNPVAQQAYQLLGRARTTLAARFLLHQAHQGLAQLFQTTNPTAADRKNALDYWPAVRYLIEGLTVVIVGPANSGKSTLLNYLAAHEQALVSDVAGTTRDYVQAELDINGLPVTLIDTAGVGHTADPLFRQARAKTIQASELADRALILLDAADPTPLNRQFAQAAQIPAVKTLIDQEKAITVLNKTDLTTGTSSPRRCEYLEISALIGTNMAQLESAIWDSAALTNFDYTKPTAFTPDQARHLKRDP